MSSGARAGWLIASAGLEAGLRRAIEAYRAGGELASDDEAAWLSVVLQDLRVRDDAQPAWIPRGTFRTGTFGCGPTSTRRARPGLVAPASVAAGVRRLAGPATGALANIALDRVQADNPPGYSMARLLREVIDAGGPPSVRGAATDDPGGGRRELRRGGRERED